MRRREVGSALPERLGFSARGEDPGRTAPPKAADGSAGEPAGSRSPASATVRVFRRQALQRYLEPEAGPAAPPTSNSFLGLWWLALALIAAALLVAWLLAADLGYPRGASEADPGSQPPSLPAGPSDG